ncbi:hypothetical protein [Campylobacter jejuni]|uniref:hypothetical protein n=2 Tax=Campylobacter jejuni TaxID=197 RepID=UPI00087490AD|nr:hypothetical protein [Campylobacter jejuni]ECK7781737.1 hypothetical protein [Campylobacter coli]AXL33885.1 hypothetical protein AEI26_04700 [Campylobacter jejuni]OEW88276.1 hypothetical protein A0M29_08200 [Campylobacter jejuni]RTH84815.1 hypothetical protein C3I39_06285 [Campylobacter jejuni]RTJ71991.1 hypothetical protein C3H60_01270 [Campylobacter jejuni]
MLVIKNNGSILENINIETIKDMIEKNHILAIVNRALSYKENRVEIEGSDDYVENIYQDDITPEEIQEGAQVVKGYCLAINELELLKQYLPLVLSGAELLTEMKAIKLIEINKDYESAILKVQKDYIPQSEMLSFETQERESLAYKNSNYQDTSLCPFMQAIATARGMDLRTLCDKAIEKATLYRQASGALIGKRQGLQDRVELVQSLEELNLIT